MPHLYGVALAAMPQEGWPIFEKGSIGESREMIYKEEGLDPQTVSYITQGSSKVCIICASVCLLRTFLKIS